MAWAQGQGMQQVGQGSTEEIPQKESGPQDTKEEDKGATRTTGVLPRREGGTHRKGAVGRAEHEEPRDIRRSQGRQDYREVEHTWQANPWVSTWEGAGDWVDTRTSPKHNVAESQRAEKAGPCKHQRKAGRETEGE